MKQEVLVNSPRLSSARGNGQMVRCPHCNQVWLTIGIDQHTPYACRSCRHDFIVADNLLDGPVAEMRINNS